MQHKFNMNKINLDTEFVNGGTIKSLISALTEIKTPFSLEYKHLSRLPKSVKFLKNHNKIRKFANLMQKSSFLPPSNQAAINDAMAAKGTVYNEIESEGSLQKLDRKYQRQTPDLIIPSSFSPSNYDELSGRKSTTQIGLPLGSFIQPAISFRESIRHTRLKVKTPISNMPSSKKPESQTSNSHAILLTKQRAMNIRKHAAHKLKKLELNNSAMLSLTSKLNQPMKNIETPKGVLSATQNIPCQVLGSKSGVNSSLRTQESSMIGYNKSIAQPLSKLESSLKAKALHDKYPKRVKAKFVSKSPHALPRINDGKLRMEQERAARRQRVRNKFGKTCLSTVADASSVDIIKRLANRKNSKLDKSIGEAVDFRRMKERCNVNSKELIKLLPALKMPEVGKRFSIAPVIWIAFSSEM
eukprot:TRINITY_DN9582_c0_g2_i1.p1 TRINITY_DN9582_c0_g2~~TRINITY_DN9582_c0_g2_i1.p1  ORF type:complete len:413 (+),score=43.67 TRINITY_DN9582_c0_g2_i1:323-1561(+)